MICLHCKDRLRLVTIDESLSKMITLQASEIHKKDGVIKDFIGAIEVLRQTVMEVRHAQSSGSDWYTNGSSGLYMQVALHLNRADDAIKSVENKIELTNDKKGIYIDVRV